MRVVLADGNANVRWALLLLLTHDLDMQVAAHTQITNSPDRSSATTRASKTQQDRWPRCL